MTSKIDVVIIGAGPAGLSAGIIFARNNIKTLVIEARRLPADKPCGEGLMPAGVKALARLGVLPFLPQGVYYPFVGIRYYGPSGVSATGLFREEPGWGISRLNLSSALLARASRENDLEIRDGQRAKVLNREPGQVQVIAGRETFTARLVVGADGLNSTVRRDLNLRGSSRKLQRWGTRQHFGIAPWSDLVEVHWRKGVEAYITPVCKDQIGVAFLWDKNMYESIEGGENLFPSLLSAFPTLRNRLAGAPTVDLARSVGPLHQTAVSPVTNGVILLGDSAGYLDALTGEGISLAFNQALALEKWVVPLLKSNSHVNSQLIIRQFSQYHKAYDKLMRPYYRLTGLALLAAGHTWLAEGAVRLFERIPALFSMLLSAS